MRLTKKQQIKLLNTYRLELYNVDESEEFEYMTRPNDLDYDDWIEQKIELVGPILTAINNAIAKEQKRINNG